MWQVNAYTICQNFSPDLSLHNREKCKRKTNLWFSKKVFDRFSLWTSHRVTFQMVQLPSFEHKFTFRRTVRSALWETNGRIVPSWKRTATESIHRAISGRVLSRLSEPPPWYWGRRRRRQVKRYRKFRASLSGRRASATPPGAPCPGGPHRPQRSPRRSALRRARAIQRSTCSRRINTYSRTLQKWLKFILYYYLIFIDWNS